ncbi:MAG: ribosomal protein S18-alanine N-acetyltransferase [bacterium]|nr:ribosomal protein S18-alanine N-acetyltransferase [bacterium]
MPTVDGELEIGRMRPDDLDQVLAIEQVSFPTPWSRAAYRREVTENSYAHYLVMRLEGSIVAYGGMWVVLDEAHITTLAVTPALRCQGLGRRVLEALGELAASLGASRISLEVRRSNLTAQRLYNRFGFSACGIRRRYYTDTNEDALIMVKEGIRPG